MSPGRFFFAVCLFEVFLGLLLTAPAGAGTATPGNPGGPKAENAYLAARDAAVAKIKRRDAAGGELNDAQMKQEARLLADLELRLRRVIGPVAVAGFVPPGKANLEALSSGDVGAGALDALVLPSRDGKAQLFVTTTALFEHWLKDHETFWDNAPALPQRPEEALRQDTVYTQAISADAAVYLYADLPVDKPGNATLAMAQLEATSQDQAPGLPTDLLVSVMRDGKLFIFDAPLKVAFAPMPGCAAIRGAYDKRQQKLAEAQGKSLETNAAGAPDGNKTVDPLISLETEADAAVRRCFAAHAQAQPAFGAARSQAKALLDLTGQ